MRPYKMTVGCTQFLQASPGTDVINFQLYSQLDYTNLKLCVHDLFGEVESIERHKLLEYLQEDSSNKSDPFIPNNPPEVYSTSVSLPYINYSIRIKGSEIKKLKQLVNKVFPKTYYIEVQ